jgi:TolB-like protein
MKSPDPGGPGAGGSQPENLTPMPRGWRLAGILALLAVAGIGLGLWQAASMRRLREAPAATVAVVRFENADNDRTLDTSCEELPRLLHEELGRNRGLRMLPWTETRSLQAADLSAEGAAAHTGASVVVLGSVRRRGSGLRIGVRLLSLRRGTALWSQTFEAEPAGLPETVRQAAREISATLLGLRRLPSTPRP